MRPASVMLDKANASSLSELSPVIPTAPRISPASSTTMMPPGAGITPCGAIGASEATKPTPPRQFTDLARRCAQSQCAESFARRDLEAHDGSAILALKRDDVPARVQYHYTERVQLQLGPLS